MATRKQIAANRRNAKKSTGPRTDAGKARSALNAVTHGLTALACVLPDEDAAEHAAFVAGVQADLAPVGMLEEAFAVQVADGMWRLLRIPRLEAACFAYELAQASERAARLREIPGLPPSAARGEEHALGAAFLKLDADGLPNSLARYEAAIQRGVERSLKLLREAQERRRTAGIAVSTLLRNRPDSPGAQTRQGFPDEQPDVRQDERRGEPERADDAPEAPESPESVEVPEAAETPVTAKPKPVRYRMEQRVHKNSRYEVCVPIEE